MNTFEKKEKRRTRAGAYCETLSAGRPNYIYTYYTVITLILLTLIE